MTEWTIFISKEDLVHNRYLKGWTQLELAEYSGIHPEAIKDFEEGKRVPSLPIQHLLFSTFKRLEHVIDSYLKLCPKEKLEFRIVTGLLRVDSKIAGE